MRVSTSLYGNTVTWVKSGLSSTYGVTSKKKFIHSFIHSTEKASVDDGKLQLKHVPAA